MLVELGVVGDLEHVFLCEERLEFVEGVVTVNELLGEVVAFFLFTHTANMPNCVLQRDVERLSARKRERHAHDAVFAPVEAGGLHIDGKGLTGRKTVQNVGSVGDDLAAHVGIPSSSCSPT
jgi:hypothetical protein